jgi:phosphatidate phosphatase APP1
VKRSGLRALFARARDPVILLPYLGYGTAGKLTVCGRALQDEGIRPAADTDRRLRNLVAFFKRLETDEVPGARLLASFSNKTVETRTNREGYFSAELKVAAQPGWNAVELELPDYPGVRATARVLVPSPRAKFGVISDIDDTVVWSNVISKARMLLTVSLSNARTRKPFKGAAAFYQALHRGKSGNVNPFFYVSKSPWNLFVPLVDFLELQRFPPGPLLLRNFGLRNDKNHKTARIEEIFATYPRMKFILIGDSGEKDPEIYREIVRRHPKRVRVIYIRSVNPDPSRIAAIDKLIEEVASTGCQLVLVLDSEHAAVHAAGERLIQASDLRAVRSDRKADESMLSKAAASTGALK